MTRLLQNRRRGSVLGASLILAVVIAMVVTGLVRWSLNEQRITLRHVALAKARMTAESVGEYGEAQIIARLEKMAYFPADEFMPSVRPPVIDEALLALASGGSGGGGPWSWDGESWSWDGGSWSWDDGSWSWDDGSGGLDGGSGGWGGGSGGKGGGSGGTSIDGSSSGGSQSPDSGFFRYELTPVNLVVGRFDAWHWERVDPSDPLYDSDPLVDQTLRVREVQMVSAARATDPLSGTVFRAFCGYRMQVRDAPIWGNVLFYNMDLEVAPGPAMEIHGPVHTNGNIYLQSGNGLQFHDSVTSAGHLNYGLQGGATATGDVSFRKAGTTSEFVSLHHEGAWLDSDLPTWTTAASSLWAGSVRTQEHGINPTIIPGMAPYVPDDPTTADIDELQNSAHAFIEPAMPNTSADYLGVEVEAQKFASKACLVIEVGSKGSASIYKYAPSDSGPYIRNTADGPQGFVRQELSMPPELIVDGIASDKFFDQRRGQQVNSLDLDVGILKTLIEVDGEAAAFTNAGVTFDPATEWNGIVYVGHDQNDRGGVRLVNGSSIPNRATFANGYSKGFTLATDAPLYVLGNYNADGLIDNDGALNQTVESKDEPPTRLATDSDEFAADSDMLATDSDKFAADSDMLATNSNMLDSDSVRLAADSDTLVTDDSFYGQDELVSDQTASFGPASTTADSGEGALIGQPDSNAEPPAGLAADALTILSEDWSDANSDQDLSLRIAQQTEVSAALLIGIVPTNKNGTGIYSGGVENLPRFLEDWSGVKLGYRGSMSVLYESERATEPWGSPNVYNAPNRVWAFNALYEKGILPPGTPNSRSYRRIGFTDLTEAEYQAALTDIGNQ